MPRAAANPQPAAATGDPAPAVPADLPHAGDYVEISPAHRPTHREALGVVRWASTRDGIPGYTLFSATRPGRPDFWCPVTAVTAVSTVSTVSTAPRTRTA